MRTLSIFIALLISLGALASGSSPIYLDFETIKNKVHVTTSNVLVMRSKSPLKWSKNSLLNISLENNTFMPGLFIYSILPKVLPIETQLKASSKKRSILINFKVSKQQKK